MATEQQFCLRWNNHQSTLISVFDSLLENSVLVDCTLAADGQQLKAHKVVLSACSPYLETLLSQHHDKHPIIILKDVKYSELRAMLDYMYRGEVNISQEQLGNFLKAAETLQIKGLTDSGGGGVGNGDFTPKRHSDNHSSRRQLPSSSSVTQVSEHNRSRPVNIHPPSEESRKPSLVIPTHVFDRGPQSPSMAREGSISPTVRKRRKLNSQSHSNDNSKLAAFPSDAPDTTSGCPDPLTLNPQQSPPSPPLLPQEPPLSHNFKTDSEVLRPTAIVKTELCNDGSGAEDLTMDEDDNNSNACEDERISMTTPGPSRHFISQGGFGDNKQQLLGDGSSDDISAEDFQTSSQEVLVREHHGNTRLTSTSWSPGLTVGYNDDQSHECPQCGKRYSLKGNLTRHQRFECGKRPQFQCHICFKTFTRNDTLVAHVKMVHMLEKAKLGLE